MVPWERTSKDACFMEKVKGDMKKDIFLLCFSVLLEKNKKRFNLAQRVLFNYNKTLIYLLLPLFLFSRWLVYF
jgi:hypothetical protein